MPAMPVTRACSRTIIHEADTACAPAGGTTHVVFAGSASPIAFDTLGKVGARRVAAGRDEQGFVLFDADGSNPSAMPVTLGAKDRSATSGTTMGVFGRRAGLSYGRFDAQGTPIGSPVTVTTDPSASRQAIGRGGEAALLLWSTATDLFAVPVDPQGAIVGSPFTFEPTSSRARSSASWLTTAADMRSRGTSAIPKISTGRTSRS